MNQTCRVCGEPAAGFHFGAFTCEGCKSFFGRTYNNLGSITECKNNGECVINKKNRTSCKACRLRKCLLVGMSKSGSRYGRRSNWFKIHCLLQEQIGQQDVSGVAPPAMSPYGGLYHHPPPPHIGPEKQRLSSTPSPKSSAWSGAPLSSSSPAGSASSAAEAEDDYSPGAFGPLPTPTILLSSSPFSDKDLNLGGCPRRLSATVTLTAIPPPPAAGSPARFLGGGGCGGGLFYSPSPPAAPGVPPPPPPRPAFAPLSRLLAPPAVCSPALGGVAVEQDEPIDLSLRRKADNDGMHADDPQRAGTPLDLTSKRPAEVPQSG